MGKKREDIVQELSCQGQRDEHILGVILVGSVPKGHADERSDVDVEYLVKEQRYIELARHGKRMIHTKDYDIIHTTLDQLKEAGESKKDEDHWRYKNCRVLLDKIGVLDQILEGVVQYDEDSRPGRLEKYYLGFWGNMLGAISCIERKKSWESKIYIAHSIDNLIGLIFNLNHLWAPELKWASKEFDLLEKKPEHLEERITDLTSAPDVPMMTRLWREIADLLREEGFTWVDHPEHIL